MKVQITNISILNLTTSVSIGLVEEPVIIGVVD